MAVYPADKVARMGDENPQLRRTEVFKKLAIAAACSIAVYGLAKVINRHIQLVPDRPSPVPTDELPGAGEMLAPAKGQPTGDSEEPITTESHVEQAASAQGSNAGGEAAMHAEALCL